jgi:hypothetical protein
LKKKLNCLISIAKLLHAPKAKTRMSTESASIIANTFIQFQGFEEVPAIELAPPVESELPPAELELPSVESELPPAVQPVLQRQNAGIYPPTPLPEAPTEVQNIGPGGVPASPDLQDILSFKKDFGVLRVKLADTPMTKQPQLLYFKNDMSGSMQDECSDGRSKMQHSNHTTSNILRLAAETDAEIWVQVDAFDDKVVSIIPAQRVTKDNLPQLVALVNKIMPRNSTDLELALNDSKTKIAEFKEQHPEFVVTQIFTTDGQATAGSQNNSTLAECVDPSYSNIFIGLGLDHSADTLNALVDRTGGPMHVALRLPVYAKASLPSAANAGSLIYVSDDVGGAVPAFADGSAWRRVTDRNVIS